MGSSNVGIILVAVVLVIAGAGLVLFTVSNSIDEPEPEVNTNSGPMFPDVNEFSVTVEGRGGSGDGVINRYDGYVPPVEEDEFFNPDEEYVTEYLFDNTAPALSDISVEDGTAETNAAFDERIELREEIPRPQALPQPVQETLDETEAQVDEAQVPTISKYIGKVTMRATGARYEIDKESIVFRPADAPPGSQNQPE